MPHTKPELSASGRDTTKKEPSLVLCKCEVEFPIKFFGSETPNMFVIHSRAEIAVNDTSEFIRNTDMVIDYFEDSKIGNTIKTVFDKINDFLKSFSK